MFNTAIISQMKRRGIYLLFLGLFPIGLLANVTVTPASQGICLNVSPASYQPIGDIIISENVTSDFAAQTGTTLVLTAPTGFSFQAGSGSVMFTPSRNITSASITTTLTTITVLLTVSNTHKIDVLTITGIKARATTANLTGNIIRKSPGGGTANITGDVAGGGVNHGTLFSLGTGAVITSANNGNWNSTSTWTGGKVPLCYDNVIINHQVIANIPIQNINNLTLQSGGRLIADEAVMVNGTFNVSAGAVYVHNNSASAAATIFHGVEVIDSCSTIIVKNWSDPLVPFCTGFTGNVGNLILDVNAVWNQSGLFSPSRIKGSLSVTKGQVVMDEGTGLSTELVLKEVMIYNDGSILFAKGADRNLNLTTGNFTDSSKSSGLTALMYNTYGDLTWTCNGNVYLAHDFTALQGFPGAHSGSIQITINGDLMATRGRIDFALHINGNVTFNVSGTTSLQLPVTGWFTLADYNSANVSFTTGNLEVGASTSTYFQGSAGTGSFSILNDFIYSGSQLFMFTNQSGNTTAQTLTVGRDFQISSGSIGIAFSSGSLTTSIGRDLILSGTNTVLVGQFYPYSSATTNLFIGGNCSLESGELNGTWNLGVLNFTTNGILSCHQATFEGTFHPFFGNYLASNFYINQLDFKGGYLCLFDSYITDGKTINANFGSIKLNFLSANDKVIFIPNSGNGNNPFLNLTIAGDVDITGNNSGVFTSNNGGGDEAVSIGGKVTVAGGTTSFVGSPFFAGSPHQINTLINGSLHISGGNTYFSVQNGKAKVKVNGDLNLTGGNLFLKQNSGSASLQLLGNYVQTGGTFTIHASQNSTADADTVTVEGAFSQTGGVFIFDNSVGSLGLATHPLIIQGNSYTLGGTGSFMHANHLTNHSVFGQVIFNSPTGTTYSRTSAFHDMQQVKQTIAAGATLQAAGSAFPLQIASHQSNVATIHNTLSILGTLEMGTQQIVARQQSNYYSQLTVHDGGLLKTKHAGGLYSGTAAASCILPMISGNNRMNYFLYPQSTIQYNGTENQVITGIPNGIATLNQHRYGKLEINFSGTPDLKFVCAEADSEVFVRTQLILTNGELNMGSDHTGLSGGRSINLENGSSLTRTAGYLRSEVENGTGLFNWNITSNGIYIVPFGFQSNSYIPFTYQQQSGNSGWVQMATYHTSPNNLPLPPAVTQLNGISGANNSANTVDRFWHLRTENNPVATLVFNATTAESAGLLHLKAQRWMPVGNYWEPAKGIQSNPASETTLVGSASGLNKWWTLATGSSPLPVELLAFSADCDQKNRVIRWTTSSQLNNDFFIIERSKNGKNWEILTHVKGEGTTNKIVHYEITDEDPLEAVNYYRLTQVDYDGKRTELKTVAVKNCQNESLELVHHTIEGNEITLKIYSDYSTILEIRIFDSHGKLLARKMQNTVGGINEISIQTSANSTAFYVLQLQNAFSTITKKIIKL